MNLGNAMFKKFAKIIIGILYLSMVIPTVALAARTDNLWDYPFGGNYYKTNGSAAGVDILLFGSNHYFNWGSLSGINGYGIRDNGGSMEFKNSGGIWSSLSSGGTGSSTSLFSNNDGINTFLNTGINIQAPTFQGTSTTGTSTFLNSVSVGTTSSSATLYLVQTPGVPVFIVASSSPANNLFTITSKGFVGIGTNNPTSLFQIVGTQPPTVAAGGGTGATAVVNIMGAQGGAGVTTGGQGAGISITSGAGGLGGSSNGGAGGTINFNSGNGGNSTNGAGVAGGVFNFNAGNGGAGTTTAGVGGSFSMNAGSGATPNNGNSSAGGIVTITAGMGGSQNSSTLSSGDGGIVGITAGGGATQSGSGPTGKGGLVYIEAGQGGNSFGGIGGKGGNVYITGNTGLNGGATGFTILGCNHSNSCISNVGIMTITPVTALEVNGDITDDNVKSAALLGTNATGTIIAVATSSLGLASTASTSQTFAYKYILASTTAGLIVSYTPAATSTYSASCDVNITAIVTDVAQCQISYTDETNTVVTENYFGMGLTSANLTSTGRTDFPPFGLFRAAANKPVTINLVLTTSIGSVTYNAGGLIQQISSN